MLAELDLTFLLNFSRKLFFDKNDIETLFSENRLQNRGVHYTQVNTVFNPLTPGGTGPQSPVVPTAN